MENSRKSLVQLKSRTAGSQFEASLSLTPVDLKQKLLQSQTMRQSFMGMSNNLTLASTGSDEAASVMEHSLLDLQSEQARQQLAFKEKMDTLFPQFLEVLQSRTNDSEVFDTMQDIIQTCVIVLDVTQSELQHGGINVKSTSVYELKQEIKTWKLLHALYKDRIIIQGEAADMDFDMPPLGASEKEVMLQLYTNNSVLREYQLIVDWLEACYDSTDLCVQVGHSTDRCISWENTLFQLQRQKELPFGSGVEIVKSLDPDAPVREQRPLHSLDQEDNARLSKCVFSEIRQGRIDGAMSLCKYSGQAWRAGILEGWRLHEDPNYERPMNAREKLPIEGNPRRDLWKRCAWLMADSKKQDDYTRAIAGALCGHLESLKAVHNSSWEDLLWAYLKVQIDIRVETELRTCCIKTYHQMPEAYWNSKMTLEQIFDELEVHSDVAVRDFAKSKTGIIQKYLIMDNIPELIMLMRRWVSQRGIEDNAPPLTPHMLRFFTHIILFLRQIGRIDKEEMADEIIAAYVDCLISLRDAQLVSFYTAGLPSKLQVQLYSKFLEGVNETTARSNALEQAINAGLDIENITKHIVETVRLRQPNIADHAAELHGGRPQVGDISSFDLCKIKALEWLTFLPTQRSDLLWQANAMIRYFLGEGKAECVRAAFQMVPADSINEILNNYGTKDNLTYREDCNVKEYLSYKVYITAIDYFNEWSQLYHGQPKEPPQIRADANFTERMAYEHKEQMYHTELKRWNVKLQEQLEITRDALYNVLLFPEKGWLVDPDMHKDMLDIPLDWDNRQFQLEKIRSTCIPEITLLLHKVLHLSKDYAGCVKLIDEIASESRQLFKVYNKHKLAELLSKVSESTLELLNMKLDPWGYPSTI